MSFAFNMNKCACLVFLTLSVSGSTHAAQIQDGVVTRITAMDRPLTAFGHDVQVNQLDISAKVKRRADGTTLAPAQGISYYQVYSVYSTNYANLHGGSPEYVTQLATTTSGDHGGINLFVYTLEYGYGNPTNATMNGISKSYGYSTPLCGAFSAIHYCNTGETVTGWLYGFDYSGQQSGYFQSGANSTASPFGYWSDAIYVK